MNTENKWTSSAGGVYKNILEEIILSEKRALLELYNATSAKRIVELDELVIDQLEYSIIMLVIKDYLNKMQDGNQAINNAVDYCIAHGFFKDLLKANNDENTNLDGFDEEEDKQYIDRVLYEKCHESFYEKWKEEGIVVGKKDGHQEGIVALIKCCRNLGASNNRTLKELIKGFGMQKSEAMIYMKEYWEQD